jgi:transcriptional regulator with XRE-family HTH domain
VTDGNALMIGKRVRLNRRLRGLSLRTTAELAGISPGFLSMVENGRRRLDRNTHILALATVLQVSPGELTGHEHDQAMLASINAHAAMSAVRLAIMGIVPASSAEPARSAGVESLNSEVDDTVRLVRSCRYDQAARRLPGLFTKLHHATRHTSRTERKEVLKLLLRAYRPACVVLCRNLGYQDLSFIAMERASTLAAELDDPHHHATNAYWRAWTLPWKTSGRHALRATLAAIESSKTGRGDPELLRIHGALHKITAFLYARLADKEAALIHFAEALDIAQHTGDSHSIDLQFDLARISTERVKLLFLLGLFDEAVQAGGQMQLSNDISLDWRAFFHVLLGNSLMRLGGRDPAAVDHLVRAEQLAPQYMHEERLLRQAVIHLLNRSARDPVGSDLRGLAWRIGVLPGFLS